MATLPSLITQGIALIEGNSTISDFIRQTQDLEGQSWQPQIDVEETSSTIIVKVNIADVDSNTIDVNFYNNLVNVKGVRERKCPQDTIYVKNEIQYGNFERRIKIPISVTSKESVVIRTNNGMLYIRIDKTREERNCFSMGVKVDSQPGVPDC